MAIHKAIDPTLTPHQIVNNLRDLDINGDFQSRIQEQLAQLEGDPVYERLWVNIERFESSAFEGKREAAAMTDGIIYRNVARDAALNRLAKAAASNEDKLDEYFKAIQDSLFGLYKNFESQISEAMQEIRSRI